MKIALITNFLYPDGLGGTELFCFNIANALIESGNEVYWFVPNFNKANTVYEIRGNGIQIVKFAGVSSGRQSELLFTIDSFLKEMISREIQVAHFNEFGGYEGISAELITATKRAGISTIVTLHLSNYVCQTGTLHFGGIQPCNGEIIHNRCTSCHLFSNFSSLSNLNLLVTRLFSHFFKINAIRKIPRIKRFMDGVNLKGKFILSISENADIIVSLTKSFKNVLLINAVESNKIIYIPQASPELDMSNISFINGERKGFMFIGRVNKEKGVDLLLRLSKKFKSELPDSYIDIYGPYTPFDNVAGSKISNLYNNSNIHYKGVLKPDEVLVTMNKYKGVILPSRVAEMAPLIIMEANKLKIPVIASDVPGSVELIKQYDCGLIFKYFSIHDLFDKIKMIEKNVQSFEFKQPVENTFFQTAKKYEEVYRGMLKSKA